MLLAATRGLSIIRIAFGLYILVSDLKKTTSGWLTSGEPLTKFVQGQLNSSDGFYRPFLKSVVLPNADLFAQLTVMGEWGPLSHSRWGCLLTGLHPGDMAGVELHAGEGPHEL
jgi:hypothetical protein